MTASAYATAYIPERSVHQFQGDSRLLVEMAIEDCVHKMEKLASGDPLEIVVTGPRARSADDRQFVGLMYRVLVTNDPEYARRAAGGYLDHVSGWALMCIQEVNDVF